MSIQSLLVGVGTTGPVVASNELWIGAVAGAIGLAVAAIGGAFRRGSVVGPARLDRSDSPMLFWGIIMLAIAVSLLVPAGYVSIVHASELNAIRDDDAARKAWKLPAHETVIVSVMGQVAGILSLVIADRLMVRDSPKKLGLRLRDLKSALIPAGIGAAAAIPLTYATSVLARWLWIQFGSSPPEEHALLTQLHDQHAVIIRSLIVLTAVIGAPLYEELLFRGHVQTAIVQSLRSLRITDDPDPPWLRWLPIVLAAGFFVAVHDTGAGSRWMLPPLFVLALCFGYVYERTANLWAPILMHAAFNAVSIALALMNVSG